MSSRRGMPARDATTSTTSADESRLQASSSWTIVRWTVLHRMAVLLLLVGSASVQQHLFDTSPALLVSLDYAPSSHTLLRRWAQCLVRWDTLHFLGAASPRALPSSSADGHGSGGGLVAEHSLAFQPAVVWLLRVTGHGFGRSSDVDQGVAAGWSVVQSVLLTSLTATTISVALPVLLYRLTLQTVQRHRTAKLTALLSILSTAPATLVTPTPEAFFAFFALLGHICLTSASSHSPRRLPRFITTTLLASCMFGIACAFRANGILLFGFLPWHLLWNTPKPTSSHTTFFRIVLLAIALIVAICLPALPQVWAYNRFCNRTSDLMLFHPRTWCAERIPIVYTFVQQHYWRVGFLKYWTPAQIPNWLLAAPVLSLAVHWLSLYYSANIEHVVRRTLLPPFLLRRERYDDAQSTSAIAAAPMAGNKMTTVVMTVRSAPQLLGHAHYTLALLLLLTLASHVQIALRFATPGGMPVVWWSAAALIESWSSTNGTHSGATQKVSTSSSYVHACLAALVLWNAASVVLYAGFYPPA